MIKTHGNTHWDPDTCYGCKLSTLQLSPTPAFAPHFNHAVGKYVTSDRHFRDELSRASERASETLGIDHNFEARYPGDIPAPPHSGADGVLDTRAKNLQEGIV